MNARGEAEQLIRDGWTADELPDELAGLAKESPEQWNAILEAVGVLLVDEYLKTFGLPARNVWEAMPLDEPGDVYSIPPELRTEAHELAQRIRVGRQIAGVMYRNQTLYPDAEIRAELAQLAGAELLEAIRESARRALEEHESWKGETGGEGFYARTFMWAMDAGGVLSADIDRWESLTAPYKISPEEREAARREAIGEAPPVRAWLGGRGWRPVLPAFRAEITRRAHIPDARGRTPDGTALIVVPTLRPNYHVPYSILSMNAPERVWRAAGDVSVQINAPPMDVWEHRALGAVLQIYSSHHETGRVWGDGWREVSWATWCEAVGADTRRSKEVSGAVDALFRLKGRQIRVNQENPDGSGSVALISILQSVQLDHGPGDAGAARRIADGWTGRAPLAVRVMISEPLRKLGGLWFPVAKDGALRAAAAKIRGKQTPLDFALRNELYRTRQARDGCAYVERDAFMRSHLGADTFAGYVKRRGYRTKILEPYLTAAAVLKEAGVVVDWTLDHPTTSGVRDRFHIAAPAQKNRAIAG
jgi:hypothetical protein